MLRKIVLPHTLWTVMHVWTAHKMSSAMIFPNTDAARNANEKNVVIALATKNEQPQRAGAKKKEIQTCPQRVNGMAPLHPLCPEGSENEILRET